MGSIKDRNDLDLTEAEDIKKRWQEYTEELYKKDLHDPDNQKERLLNLKHSTWNSDSVLTVQEIHFDSWSGIPSLIPHAATKDPTEPNK